MRDAGQMTNEELVEQVQAGIDPAYNMEQLYLRNRRFIYQLAKKYSRYIEMDDLLQEGYLGLYEAVKHYRPDKGVKFLSYASFRIERTIRRYTENNSYSKRIPAYMLRRVSAYNKYLAACQASGTKPTAAEICTALGITESQLAELRKVIREVKPVSLDEHVDGSDELTFEEIIPDPLNFEEETIEQLTKEYFEKVIWDIVAELDDRQGRIISGHYRYSKTLKGLSEELHLSHERVRQIRNGALQILRRKRQIREAAEFYGCEYSRAYNTSGISSFKRQGSSVENIAMRRIEQEERIAHLKGDIADNKGIIKQSLGI